MKTNFKRESFLVLTNNESKIVAIIQCKKGKQDITEKLTQAIREDYDSEEVVILSDESQLDEFAYEFNFNASIKGHDDYEDIENFTLTTAFVY